MVVRTYGRRSQGGIVDVSDDPFSFPEEEEESPQDYNFTFSSQDSARWTFDSEPYPVFLDSGLDPSTAAAPSRSKPLQLLDPVGGGGSVSGSKKAKKEKGDNRLSRPPMVQATASPPLTATLMETQEFGEMMEYVDELNFTLDGLRKQPVRIRRASLLSLLAICETSQQRGLLRAQGMAKTIVDAIMGLSLDDSPSNLAASALFYVLTADGQENYLLDSSSSIGFLIKLLKPLVSDNVLGKTSIIGHKLLALRKDAHISQKATKKADSSGDAIVQKVKEILVNCEDIKASDDSIDGLSLPELSPKWIALLTMEKACLSNVSLEEGTVRRTSGNFKETLRESGGLDAVFQLAISLRSILQGLLDHISTSSGASKDEKNLQCPVLLLKCLKIMENATFLSKENQVHLLAMRQSLGRPNSSLSFITLVIDFIKILSDLCLLRRNSSTTSVAEKHLNISTMSGQYSEFHSLAENKDIGAVCSKDSLMRSSQECSWSGRVFPSMGSIKSQSEEWLSSQSGSLDPATKYEEDDCMIKMRIKSSTSSSCSMTSKSSGCGGMIHDARLKMKSGLGKRPSNIEDASFADIEYSQDPFAFDEDEVEPSSWDVLSRRSGVARAKRSRVANVGCKTLEGGFSSKPIPKHEEVKHIEFSSKTSCSYVGEERSNVLTDCLLTSVKVLMNLTNDNEIGCQQIAACGGLETVSSLIVSHFPSFWSSLHSSNEMKKFNSLSDSVIDLESVTNKRLSDQEIDLLVAILGLLVNMVEKDDQNRAWLAAASVSIPCSPPGLAEESQRDVIPLLCSIFMANQGAGEAVAEGNEPWCMQDEEFALLQGEREAEKMIIEAYSALLLAFLSTESQSTREAIANYLPTQGLAVLVPVLKRFVAFHVALDMISPKTHKTVNEVIESLRMA